MPRIYLASLAAVVIAAGAQPAAQPVRATWPTYAVAAAPPEWRHTISQGDLIIAAVNASLRNELARDLPSGTTTALTPCHIDTIAVETGMARGKGVAVGRTSARLPNSNNRPPPWTAAIVARHATGHASRIDGFVVDLGDRIGLLRPIAHRPICDPCHSTVPTSALFRHGEQWAVYVMDAGRARRTVLELGRQTGQSAEVTAGLAEGTRVILHPGDRLADGARVRKRLPVK